LVALCLALGSQEGFDTLTNLLENNFLAHLCEDFEGGKMISWTAIIVGVILSLLSGVLVWA